MILRNHLRLGLPRRVVVYYLFFCLAAVCWLAVGVVLTTQAVISSRSENVCLSRIGQAAPAIEVDYIRNGTDNFPQLISRLKTEGRLAYCSIVDLDGKVLAHTSPSLVGQPAVEHSGQRLRWGDVEGTNFTDEQRRSMREYRVALRANHKPIGSLRAASVEPGLWGTLRQTADVAPLAILAPLLLVGVGAIVLSRQASPLAEMEGELRRIARLPIGQNVELKPQRGNNACSIGWNRVVSNFVDLRETNDGDSAETRLSKMAVAWDATGENAIWKHLSDGIAIADGQGQITQANKAMAVLLGKTVDAETLIGTGVEEHLSIIGDTSSQTELTDPANQQRTVVIEFAAALDGTDHFLRVARQPLRNESGVAEGHLWTIRDVTQQKLAEQMRDQFMDAATHELRTPLANIKAYAETLASMKELDIESQKDFCNTINSEATRLARFVDDLLSISSMEVGSLSIDRQNIDAQRMLNEVVDKVRPLVRQKSLEFDVDLPAKMPELSLDKDKIVAMLVNLLGNAVKYTPAGGRVGLKVKLSEDSLQVDIDDTGVGIAANELPKVFEKFFRSADPRVLEQSGTGLGLSLALEVVRLHGGDISVHSEVDKGSTFTVILPVTTR